MVKARDVGWGQARAREHLGTVLPNLECAPRSLGVPLQILSQKLGCAEILHSLCFPMGSSGPRTAL